MLKHLIASDSDSHHHRAYLEQQNCLNPAKNTWNGTNEKIIFLSQSDAMKIIPNSQVKQIDKDNKQIFQAVENTNTINKYTRML